MLQEFIDKGMDLNVLDSRGASMIDKVKDKTIRAFLQKQGAKTGKTLSKKK